MWYNIFYITIRPHLSIAFVVELCYNVVAGQAVARREGVLMMGPGDWDGSAQSQMYEQLPLADIPLEGMTEQAKRRVLMACSECSIHGFNKHTYHKSEVEFATLLDAQTGEAIPGYSLYKGEEDAVQMPDAWETLVFEAPRRSLILVHNHTIETPISFQDIEVFLNYPALRHLVMTTGKHIASVERTETAEDVPPQAFLTLMMERALDVGFRESGNVGATTENAERVYSEIFPLFGFRYWRWV